MKKFCGLPKSAPPVLFSLNNCPSRQVYGCDFWLIKQTVPFNLYQIYLWNKSQWCENIMFINDQLKHELGKIIAIINFYCRFLVFNPKKGIN